LDWVAAPIPVQCDGLSLLTPVNTGEFPDYWRDEAHWEFDFRSVINGEAMEQKLGLTLHQCTLNVIRDENYKYVHFTNLPPLFFDLTNDPDELVNQAENPEYTSRLLHYTQKMLSWRMNHDEQTLTHMALDEDGLATRAVTRYPR
jgi:arylsulfatase A-like enzyme